MFKSVLEICTRPRQGRLPLHDLLDDLICLFIVDRDGEERVDVPQFSIHVSVPQPPGDIGA
jgi:hypothetical protein